MESTARAYGHPIHPMLIPYPFALLTSGVAFDVAARASGRTDWSRTAARLTTVGIGAALVAAVPGIIDYFGTVPPRSAARGTATRHALSNLSGLACFAAANARRRSWGTLPGSGLALAILGTGFLAMGGLLGSTLVYHHHVGVSGERAEEPLEAPHAGPPQTEMARTEIAGETPRVAAADQAGIVTDRAIGVP